MALLSTTRHLASRGWMFFGTREDRGLRRWPGRALTLLLVWQERASQRRHLESLDERYLRDMGLSRADVAREAAKPFWKA